MFILPLVLAQRLMMKRSYQKYHSIHPEQVIPHLLGNLGHLQATAVKDQAKKTHTYNSSTEPT